MIYHIGSRKKIFFSIVSVVLLVCLIEVALQIFSFLFPKVNQLLSPSSITVPDERLGHRPSPNYSEHDRKGFRNKKVPTEAYLVALGDSQTYGTGVNPDEAWPRQLETKIGKTVYSIAYGGYGPVHSLALWNEAVQLSPKIIIEAFYAGNDLFDSFNIVYNLGQFPELKSKDLQLQAEVMRMEQVEPIAKHASEMFSMKKDSNSLFFRKFLSQYSKSYGLLRSFKQFIVQNSNKMQWESAKKIAEQHPAYCQIFNNEQFKTIFTSEYRLSALNISDPRIAEGLQLSLQAILRMHEYAKKKNILFIVVLIPTKEAVFSKIWQKPSGGYLKLEENERKVWIKAKEFFKKNGISYIDALLELQKQLADGIQPYQITSDGHPNKYGHKEIARLVYQYIENNEQ